MLCVVCALVFTSCSQSEFFHDDPRLMEVVEYARQNLTAPQYEQMRQCAPQLIDYYDRSVALPLVEDSAYALYRQFALFCMRYPVVEEEPTYYPAVLRNINSRLEVEIIPAQWEDPEHIGLVFSTTYTDTDNQQSSGGMTFDTTTGELEYKM